MTKDPSIKDSKKDEMQYKMRIDGFNLNDILKDEFIRMMEYDFNNFQSLFLGLVIGDLKKENVVLLRTLDNTLEMESFKEENIKKIKTLICSFKEEE